MTTTFQHLSPLSFPRFRFVELFSFLCLSRIRFSPAVRSVAVQFKCNFFYGGYVCRSNRRKTEYANYACWKLLHVSCDGDVKNTKEKSGKSTISFSFIHETGARDLAIVQKSICLFIWLNPLWFASTAIPLTSKFTHCVDCRLKDKEKVSTILLFHHFSFRSEMHFADWKLSFRHFGICEGQRKSVFFFSSLFTFWHKLTWRFINKTLHAKILRIKTISSIRFNYSYKIETKSDT